MALFQMRHGGTAGFPVAGLNGLGEPVAGGPPILGGPIGGGGGGHHHHGGGGYRAGYRYGGYAPYYAQPTVLVVEPQAACPEVFSPVLGTDGQVYDNACLAHRAGAQVAKLLSPKQAAKARGFAGLSGVSVLGDTAGVEALRAALNKLSLKISAANPGPAKSGDSGYVTDGMIGAVAAIVSRVPNIPSEVKTGLNLLGPVGIPLLETTSVGRAALDKVRIAISSYASRLSQAVNAYAAVAPSGSASSTGIYPAGSISTFDAKISLYRIALPKGVSLSDPLGATAAENILPGSALAKLGEQSGTHTEIGTAKTPGNTTVVTPEVYDKATSSWYTSWKFWVPVGVGAAGLGTLLVLWLRKRKPSRRRRGR